MYGDAMLLLTCRFIFWGNCRFEVYQLDGPMLGSGSVDLNETLKTADPKWTIPVRAVYTNNKNSRQTSKQEGGASDFE